MSVAIASAVESGSRLQTLLRRDDLGRPVRLSAGAFGLVVAGGLIAATVVSGAAACTGTTLVASAVEVPSFSYPA